MPQGANPMQQSGGYGNNSAMEQAMMMQGGGPMQQGGGYGNNGAMEQAMMMQGGGPQGYGAQPGQYIQRSRQEEEAYHQFQDYLSGVIANSPPDDDVDLNELLNGRGNSGRMYGGMQSGMYSGRGGQRREDRRGGPGGRMREYTEMMVPCDGDCCDDGGSYEEGRSHRSSRRRRHGRRHRD